MLTRAPLAFALSLVVGACKCGPRSTPEKPGAQTKPVPPIPEAALAPVTQRVSSPLCGHPDEASIRALPDRLAPCERDPAFWRYTAGEREVFVISAKADDEGRWGQAAVFIDRRWYGGGPPTPPFWSQLDGLATLDPANARALLESIVATDGVDERFGTIVVTTEELERELARWPNATTAAEEARLRPPAFGRDTHGFHVRAWFFLRPMRVEKGTQCPVASRVEWSIVDGVLHRRPLVNHRLAEDVGGGACVGAP
jgi:hypothetical protein